MTTDLGSRLVLVLLLVPCFLDDEREWFSNQSASREETVESGSLLRTRKLVSDCRRGTTSRQLCRILRSLQLYVAS